MTQIPERKAKRRRCWNFKVKPASFNGRRLCYRLARPRTDLCPTCEIGGMDPG
jgi:hypothetical protein